MNALGVLLIGAAVRCTAFALLGLLLYAVLRRKGPSAGSLVALTTLMILVAVSALSLCPWPRWWTVAPRAVALASRPQANGTPVRREAEAPPGTLVETAAPGNHPAQLKAEASESTSAVFLRALWQEFQRPAVAAQASHWGWLAWCVVLFVACAALGLSRLVLGLRAVQVLRRRSEAIDDQGLRDLVDILRAEASCTRNVEVHQSAEITTPATVGWLRPLILLPASWREWDERERRVVLAHELAHVYRNDYLSGLLAQLSLAVHFYHPLAHWLLGRLRLQQELAADSLGARLAGGSPLYLTTLAQMALRQADRPVSWPARAFLPTRGTFLRRIEMLRDAQTLPPVSLSRFVRVFTIGALATAGMLIAGLRGGDGPNTALAQAAQPPGARPDSGAASAPYDFTYVPAATDLLLAVRPATLLARPDFKPIIEAIRQNGPAGLFKLPLEEMDQVLLIWLRPSGNQAPDGRAQPLPAPSAAILRSTSAKDWKTLAADILGETVAINHLGQVYNRAAKGPHRESYFTPDDRTMILASETDLQFLMGAGKGPLSRHPWDEAWKQVEKGQVTLALGASWFTQRLLPKVIQTGAFDADNKLAAFSPLWTMAHGYAIGLDLSKGLAIDIAATCGSDEGAEKVDQTAQALLTLAGNCMDGLRRQIAVAPREAVQPMQLLADTIDPLLQKARGEHKGRVVHVRSSTDVDFEGVVKMLVPAVQSARIAAKRAQSTNNLKQLALAMHNYHNTHNKFPAAVMYGPDGKTPYTWRIALLPFLEQKSLYDQYRFTEPWDGPNNRKLLDQIPEVFSFPSADGGRKLAYFALVGPATLFGVEGGTNLADITDGTSNTIMFVEAKRDIPWTKPEDIPYEASKPLPELGGLTAEGFNAAFADGAVLFIKSTVKEATLRALFTRNGGEILSRDSF
jgi:hypothetical protein